jgi:hypothetical protein
MLPIEPEREILGRTIVSVLMAKEIKRLGQVHSQTVLTEIGALAGFAAQMAIRKAIIAPGKFDPNEILPEVVTKNGEKYYFSDTLNWVLFENLASPPYSIWAYLLDVVPPGERGALPDLADILGYAARTIGSFRFGVPRLPAEQMPHKTPRSAIEEHWAAAQREFEAAGRDPAAWPFDLAYAAQWQMVTSRDRVPLLMAARIVMEAAIPMSKIDPATVPGALDSK